MKCQTARQGCRRAVWVVCSCVSAQPSHGTDRVKKEGTRSQKQEAVMRSISISSAVQAPPNPETLREARLRSRGLPPATARVVALLAFGPPREAVSWPTLASSVAGGARA